MATSNLAKTTFNSGPDDALATIDAYSKKITTTSFNSFQDFNFSFGLDKLSALSGIGGKDLLLLIKALKNKKIPLSLNDIITRLFGDNPLIMTLFRTLNASMQSKFALNNVMNGRVSINIGGVPFTFKTKDLTSAKSLSKIIDGYTKGNYKISFTDQGALAGKLTSIINNAGDQGLPQVYAKTMATVTDRNIQVQATTQVTPNTVKTKNISLLNEIANGPVPADARAAYPNIVRDFVTDLTLPAGTKEKDYKLLYDSLKDSFSKLDPNWNKTIRNNQEVLFLDLITPFNCSVFHKLVDGKNRSETKPIPFTSEAITDIDAFMPVYDSNECFYSLVKSMGKQNAGTILRRNFPTVPFTTDPSQSNFTQALVTI